MNDNFALEKEAVSVHGADESFDVSPDCASGWVVAKVSLDYFFSVTESHFDKVITWYGMGQRL